MTDQPKSQRSVLRVLGERIGLTPKVLLPDLDSAHGASPVLDPNSAASKLVPQGRGNYQLLGEIARGGMGVILKGHDTDLGRDVAVKVLDEELSKRPAVVQRFVEEAQIGGQLQHPGIVPVYELGLMGNERPYFTMKLVKGRTLAALLAQRKTPADNRARLLAIFEAVCQTMAYAHSKGVLHRDLKPANVMIGAFGEVQVVDWGLAKVLRRGGAADEKRAEESALTVIETVRSGSSSTASESMVGSIMGTPAYMAPEQAQGEVDRLDERADVFSLGAILCEILTGRPPYEAIEGEPIVKQAAKARLDPARARIEACDADPSLVRLCLECLMPARDARPSNAGEVATAIHQYLVSVEERAQKAELAAAEARIKAAEERRARRLTVALGGTVGAALLLGGGAFYWVNRERARRAEQTRTVVEAAYGESIALGQEGKPAEALDAARRALSLAESGGADAMLLDRARHFVENAELAVGAAERERTLHEQDETLRERLIELRMQQIETLDDPQRASRLDADFALAFRDYGVDLEGDDVVPALNRIRERAIAAEVALALDDWGRVRRKVHGAKSEKAENLSVLALDLDPDPLRARMRQAVATNDVDAMLELCAPEYLPKLGPGSIFVLTAALWEGSEKHWPDVSRMLDQALRSYPEDYVLQATAGSFYVGAVRRFPTALACRTAALSLRPHDLTARLNLADVQFWSGRFPDAAKNARIVVAANPSDALPHYVLGSALMELGDYAGALESLTRAAAIKEDPFWRPYVHAAQYFNNLLTREEVKRYAESQVQPFQLSTYLHALLTHPDPKQRDPEFVLRTLAEQASWLSEFQWPRVHEAVARIRLEDWPGALAVIESGGPPARFVPMTSMGQEFMRSLVFSRAGRSAEARACYERGMFQWNEITADDPAAWDRSEAMSWRRDAEAALAK